MARVQGGHLLGEPNWKFYERRWSIAEQRYCLLGFIPISYCILWKKLTDIGKFSVFEVNKVVPLG